MCSQVLLERVKKTFSQSVHLALQHIFLEFACFSTTVPPVLIWTKPLQILIYILQKAFLNTRQRACEHAACIAYGCF